MKCLITKTTNMANGNNLIHSFADNGYLTGNCRGLTKREHFAVLFMAALLSNDITTGTTEYFSKKAIECADELLKQLEPIKND